MILLLNFSVKLNFCYWNITSWVKGRHDITPLRNNIMLLALWKNANLVLWIWRLDPSTVLRLNPASVLANIIIFFIELCLSFYRLANSQIFFFNLNLVKECLFLICKTMLYIFWNSYQSMKQLYIHPPSPSSKKFFML